MSRATIVKNLGKGLYRVKLNLDLRVIKYKIEEFDKRIIKANYSINHELQDAVTLSLAELNAIVIPDAILKGDILKGDSNAFNTLMQQLDDARAKYNKAALALTKEKQVRESSTKERAQLLNYVIEDAKPSNTVDIWCADYSTGLQLDAEVGVIDWFQYGGKVAVKRTIQPNTKTGTNSKYNSIRDGERTPLVSMTHNSWWLCMGFLPGSERFNPHFRKGTITAINPDRTLNVTVDAVYTQALHTEADNISESEHYLTNISAKYMTCNVGAFKVDDRVVVEIPLVNKHAALADKYRAEATTIEQRRQLSTHIA